MDTTIFLDINRFARRTAVLHRALGALAGKAGLVLLAAVVVVGLAQVLLGWSRRRPGPVGALWPLVAVAVAVGLGELIGHLLDQARPAESLKGIEVLGSPANGFSLPDLRAVAAAAICVGLFVLGARVGAALALLAALLVAFTEVYVGAHFPFDELAGLGLGALVALAGYPLLRRQPASAAAHRSPSLTAELSGLARPVALAPSGPAAQPVPIAASGSVRLIEAPTTGGELGTLPPPLRVRGAAAPLSPPAGAADLAPRSNIAVFPRPPAGPSAAE